MVGVLEKIIIIFLIKNVPAPIKFNVIMDVCPFFFFNINFGGSSYSEKWVWSHVWN